MKRILRTVAAGCLVSILTCTPAWAQATAQISGTARDQSGGVLPGVDITATQTNTGVTRTSVTNETGAFVLPNLPLGPYRLEAALSGFRSYVQTGIVLQVNSSPVVNPVLELGQVTESVSVEANAALVETRSNAVGVVIENERILELPLNGRDVIDLIMLAGGAVKTADGRGASLVGAASPQIAIAGSAGFGVDYTLDGANHVSFVTGSTMVMPFPDAMQEFKVETSGVTAQRGNSTAVAAVTKSGTNQLHGSLFEFLRNDLFNAKPYFAGVNRQTGEKVGSTLKRNQFGGTVGGPIVQNRLFFFGGYQGTTLRQDPADIRAFVPTTAMLAGDWTAFASPACNNGRQVNLRAPFVNNRIDPALFSRPALAIVNYKGKTPFPQADNACGEVTYGNMSKSNEAHYVGKLDFQATNDHSLFARFFMQAFSNPDPREFNTNLLQDTGWRNTHQRSVTLGSTYVFSASTVQALRVGYNGTLADYNNVDKGELFTWCDIGVNIYCAPEITRVFQLNINGGFSSNSNNQFLTGHRYAGESYSLNYDLTQLRGSHQLSVGLNARHGRQRNFSIWVSPHQFNFNGSATGLGLADFMIGRPAVLQTGNSNPHVVNGTTVGLYAADSWRMTPKVTLNYGVRWEPFMPPAADVIYNFDYERFQQGIKSSVFVNAPAGVYFPGDPGFPKNGVNTRWNQFAPRVGVAWDVQGDGRTSVRAAYARSYLYVPGDFRETYSGGSPYGSRVTLASPIGGLEDPWRGVPGGNIFPYELNANAPFPPSGLFYTQPYDLRTPSSHSWDVAFQRQVGSRMAFSTSYIGSRVVNLWSNKALNPAIFFPGNANAAGACVAQGYTFRTTPNAPCSTLGNTNLRRKFTLERPDDGRKMGYVAEADGHRDTELSRPPAVDRRAADHQRERAGESHVVALRGSVRHDLQRDGAASERYVPGPQQPGSGSRGLRFRPAAHVESDDGCRDAAVHEFGAARPRERMENRGHLQLGVRQTATVFAGSDRALNGLGVGAQGNATQRADQVLENPYGDKSGRPLTSWLNPAAFALPAPGTLGNMKNNSILGPPVWSFDMAVSRVFRVFTDQRMEFRAEAFNVTNTFRAGDPNISAPVNTTLNNANFGLIRSALAPRILQFALKYVF